ncbi:MAG: N-acetylmuramoyl-L-alanine amidase, partial [Pseudomonadota bacterium]
MTGGPEPAIKRLSLPETEVSAHYLICEAGGITRLVPEAERAWHAGAGRWGECWDVNSASIGVELSNDGASPFSAAQMDALEDLLADILARHNLPPQAVIGHSDTAPGRKRDPGPRFDWRRLALRGLAIWPEPADGEPP